MPPFTTIGASRCGDRRERDDARGGHALIDDDVDARRPEAESSNVDGRGSATHGVEAKLAAFIGHAANRRAVDGQLGAGDRSTERVAHADGDDAGRQAILRRGAMRYRANEAATIRAAESTIDTLASRARETRTSRCAHVVASRARSRMADDPIVLAVQTPRERPSLGLGVSRGHVASVAGRTAVRIVPVADDDLRMARRKPRRYYVRNGYIRHGHPSPTVMRSRDPRPADFLPLTPAVLHILLALADGEQHGYAIAQAVEALTDGTVRMGPGTLYGSIGRMVASGLIEESTRSRGRAAMTSDADSTE